MHFSNAISIVIMSPFVLAVTDRLTEALEFVVTIILIGVRRGITQHLSKKGYKTRGDKVAKYNKKRKPGVWGQSSVARILSNPAYKGITTYAKIQVNIPPIVEEWMWDEAQKRRAENRKHKRHQTKHIYSADGLFATIARVAWPEVLTPPDINTTDARHLSEG